MDSHVKALMAAAPPNTLFVCVSGAANPSVGSSGGAGSASPATAQPLQPAGWSAAGFAPTLGTLPGSFLQASRLQQGATGFGSGLAAAAAPAAAPVVSSSAQQDKKNQSGWAFFAVT